MPEYNWQYNFDGNTITVATDDPHWKNHASKQSWAPCEHLKPVLIAFLAKGVIIEGAGDGWSKAKLVVGLSKGLNRSATITEAKNRGLGFFENDAYQYPSTYGLYCEVCQHGIDWPQDQSTINAI
ncbi:hypothetical protein SCL_0447 [Sulfuricaulis limicola]|uniref:Uncharacterized protein n=1 Tax=Sulfuricaulis limicola TaxID=1620215 RepID=A0A1B4XD87_9GAMM|nr:hypothetical protein [Sulfuricaulis limicola]BAV32769.1 hypothetical protein SCL_0447 [Sulfuricaulis limicola]